MGVRTLNVTAGHWKNTCNWRDPTIVSLPSLRRRNTIDSVQMPKRRRQAYRQGGRHDSSESGMKMGGREGGIKGIVGRREQRDGVRKR